MPWRLADGGEIGGFPTKALQPPVSVVAEEGPGDAIAASACIAADVGLLPMRLALTPLCGEDAADDGAASSRRVPPVLPKLSSNSQELG